MAEIRVVAAAILQEGRVLAALRGPTMKMPGVWELPGGKVEAEEDDRAALRRELEEELGVDVYVGDWIAESVHAYERVTVRLVCYACRLERGEPRPIEHAELRWVGGDELSALGWADADVPLLHAVARRLG